MTSDSNLTSQTRMRQLSGYFKVAVLAIIVALIVRTFILTAYRVPTTSMVPGLKPGDYVFASRASYEMNLPGGYELWSRLPKRGDVVIFRYRNEPGTIYAKRVIGLPGDHILVERGRVSINEQPLEYAPGNDALIEDLPGAQYLSVFSEQGQTLDHAVVFNESASSGASAPVVVPPGHIFLLGDNRDASDDSRDRGPVALSDVEGRVVFIWLSLNYHQKWLQNRLPEVRWERTFSFVD